MKKRYKAKSVANMDKIPTHINGVCVRPVDMNALNRVIDIQKGKIEIPGVEIECVEIPTCEPEAVYYE